MGEEESSIVVNEDATAEEIAPIAKAVNGLFVMPVAMRSRNIKGVRVEKGEVVDFEYTGPVLERVLKENRVIRTNLLGPVTIWGTDILFPKNSNTDETRSRFTRLTLRDCVPDRILHNKFKMSGFDMRFFTSLSCVHTSF